MRQAQVRRRTFIQWGCDQFTELLDKIVKHTTWRSIHISLKYSYKFPKLKKRISSLPSQIPISNIQIVSQDEENGIYSLLCSLVQIPPPPRTHKTPSFTPSATNPQTHLSRPCRRSIKALRCTTTHLSNPTQMDPRQLEGQEGPAAPRVPRSGGAGLGPRHPRDLSAHCVCWGGQELGREIGSGCHGPGLPSSGW